MVLDPLSALSVASNVVQCVEYSGALISRAVELYRSSIGLLGSEINIETGKCAGDGKHGLKRFKTVERDGAVYVVV